MAKKRKKKSPDELSTENELMKLKMIAEFGGDFVGDEDIPPDIENQFLKQIINFHKLHDQSKVTSVYKYIGEPEYNHVHDLSDKEVVRELKHLMKLMEKNGVSLTVLAETPKREVYRFVTEELFKHEIEDVKVKGWLNQFVYEEFYPNPDYDVKSTASLCLVSIFTKESHLLAEHFSEEMKDSIGLQMDTEEMIERIKNFHNHFYNIKLVDHNFSKVEINKEAGTAHVVGEITYKTQTQKGRRFKMEDTVIEFYLSKNKHMDGWWEIQQVVTDLF